MKGISHKVVIILLLTTFFIQGCKKDTPATTTVVTGNLFGFVTLYDQYGAKVSTGASTVAVTLNTPSGSTLNTAPDSAGRYTYNNIVQGQYLISFACPGYGSILNSELGFLGEGSIDHDVKLSAIPNFSDSIINTAYDSANIIVINGTFSGTDTRKRTYAVFVGSTPAVSSAPSNYLTYYTGTSNNNLVNFNLKIQVSDLYDLGFTSGSTVYFAGYGAAADFASTSDVEDYANTGRLSFTALSSSAATTSFTLP